MASCAICQRRMTVSRKIEGPNGAVVPSHCSSRLPCGLMPRSDHRGLLAPAHSRDITAPIEYDGERIYGPFDSAYRPSSTFTCSLPPPSGPRRNASAQASGTALDHCLYSFQDKSNSAGPEMEKPSVAESVQRGGATGAASRTTRYRILMHVMIVVAALIVGASFGWLESRFNEVKTDNPSGFQRLQACITSPIGRNAMSADAPSYDITDFCFNMIVRGEMLDDYSFRRMIFAEQSIRTSTTAFIVLILLAVMTICGIALAAMQLVFAYRLASQGRAGFTDSTEATIAQKASIRSSVSGVIIVATGLVFFIVWTRTAFTVNESPLPPNIAAQVSSESATLSSKNHSFSQDSLPGFPSSQPHNSRDR